MLSPCMLKESLSTSIMIVLTSEESQLYPGMVFLDFTTGGIEIRLKDKASYTFAFNYFNF